MRIYRPRRDVFLFLIFLVLSGLFWLSTALNGYYDYEVDIPLVLTNVPASIVPTSDDIDGLRVMVHDKGFALLTQVRHAQRPPLQIDYRTYATPAKKCIVSPAELQKLVAKTLPNSTTINAIKPDKIEMTYIDGVPKQVPVRLVGNLTPAQNYYLEHAEVNPAQVTIYADATNIDDISAVETEMLEMKDFADTICHTVPLKVIPNTKAVPNEVTVTLYPDILTEEEVEVPITAVNVPSNVTLRTFPQRVVVRFTVGASMYRTIDFSQFRVELDYDELAPQNEKGCIFLAEMPKGVKTATLTVDEVDYLIEN